MQIHELNRQRRTDEGLGDWARAAGTALKQAVSPGLGTTQNTSTKSAGILDPKQKLAAVMKEPAMVKLATQYAKEWVTSQATPVPEAAGTYNKKTGAATLDGKPMTSLSDLPQHIQQQIQAKQQAAAPVVPTPAPGPRTASVAPGFNASNVMTLPGMAKYARPAAPAATAPTGNTAATTASAAAATYLKDFLAFANEKIAIRDSATYKMIGLADAEKSKLKPELDAAKQAVVSAQSNPAATEAAVKNYILTAMAAAQLVASENAVAAASPQAPAYGQQPATATAAGQASNPAAAPATGQLTGSNAVALLNKAGLPARVLTPAGQAIQSATGNRQLSATGDSVIDTMLEGMGYTVS